MLARLDESRKSDECGTGLGLSMTKFVLLKFTPRDNKKHDSCSLPHHFFFHMDNNMDIGNAIFLYIG